MPHVIVRFFTVKKVSDARKSAGAQCGYRPRLQYAAIKEGSRLISGKLGGYGTQVKRQKLFQYLAYRGWETELIYQQINRAARLEPRSKK